MLAERVAYLSVGKFLQFLVADEQGIDIVVLGLAKRPEVERFSEWRQCSNSS